MLSSAFGVVTTNPRAFFHLSHCALNRFAHFDGHQPRKSAFLCFENLSSVQHPSCAISHGSLFVGSERFHSSLQLLVDLRFTQRVKSLKSFTSSRVN